jgi:hypothetical protein
MLLRSVSTIVAIAIVCVLFPRSDADVRGGGFHHSGMAANVFTGVDHFRFQRGRRPIHGDMHGNHMHRVARWHGHNWSHRFAGAEYGRWHPWPGFGSTRRLPIADGQWYEGGAFR